MFFPKSIGLSIHGNDLIISKTSQKFLKCASESTVVKDFLLKESLDLKLIIDARGFQTRDIILSWPREKTVVREIELPGSSINELRESISYQLDSFILFSEDDVYYDLYPSNSSEYGEKAFLFAIKKEELDEIMSKLESSNLKPNRVIISPLTYVPLVNDNKVTVIEKCKDSYTFNLYTDSILVNTALARTEDDLKEKITENKPGKMIFLDQKTDNVFGFSKDEIAQYQMEARARGGRGHHPISLPSQGGDKGEVIKFNRIPIDIEQFCENDIKVELWERSKESLGAALNGLSECLNRFNVLKVKGKRYVSQLALTGILSFLILAFAFILPGIIKHNKVESIRAIDARLEELHPKVMISSRFRDEIYSVLETTSKIKDIVKNKSSRVHLLAELTRAIPDDTWIKQLSIKKGNFEIEGVGLSGAKVLTLLENSPEFQHVSFSSSVVKDRSGKEKFKIKGNTR
ncbi:MAG: PilN domain-containing protein [Candidatus Scalinduaceae bacterium]